MVDQRQYPSSTHDEAPPLDDTWWSALLADEERYTNFSNARTHMQDSASLLSPSLVRREMPALKPVASPASRQGVPRKGKPGRRVNWQRAQELFVQDEVVHLRVIGANRGGLLVAGSEVYGFVPVSHLIDVPMEITIPKRDDLLKTYTDQMIPLKIIECDPKKGRLIFSQRAALAGEGQRNTLLEHLQDGARMRGVVTNITDFGVFVDLGGVEGLIHISELSWGRVQHPEQVVHIGDEVETVVLSLDRSNCRVALSLKRLFPNPWETAVERYFPGLVVMATITSVVPFGAFARLEEGLDGLIHASGMHMDPENAKPAERLSVGQQVQVRVLHVDAKRQRLGLCLCLNMLEEGEF